MQGAPPRSRLGVPGFPARQQPIHTDLAHLGDGEQRGGIRDLPLQVAAELLRLLANFAGKGSLLAPPWLPLDQVREALTKALKRVIGCGSLRHPPLREFFSYQTILISLYSGLHW